MSISRIKCRSRAHKCPVPSTGIPLPRLSTHCSAPIAGLRASFAGIKTRSLSQKLHTLLPACTALCNHSKSHRLRQTENDIHNQMIGRVRNCRLSSGLLSGPSFCMHWLCHHHHHHNPISHPTATYCTPRMLWPIRYSVAAISLLCTSTHLIIVDHQLQIWARSPT